MITEQYTLLVKFTAKLGKEQELKDSLIELVVQTVKEDGCLNFDLHQLLSNPREFMLYENWLNKDFHTKHNQSRHVLNWRENYYHLLETNSDKTIWKYLKLES